PRTRHFDPAGEAVTSVSPQAGWGGWLFFRSSCQFTEFETNMWSTQVEGRNTADVSTDSSARSSPRAGKDKGSTPLWAGRTRVATRSSSERLSRIVPEADPIDVSS